MQHGELIGQIAKQVGDKPLLELIRSFLNAEWVQVMPFSPCRK